MQKRKPNITKDDAPTLIRQIAIPASIGFFFNTMYNVIDTYYAGSLSTNALAALSLSFPIFFIILAFGQGISQGATALMTNALGEKKKKVAKAYATQSITFGIFLSIILTIIGYISLPFLFKLLGATGEYLDISLAYMNIIVFATVFFLFVYIFNGMLVSQGDTKSMRNMLIIGFLANLLLDPLFIFGWFGIPKMGVAGIALATLLIQAAGTVYLWYKALKTTPYLKNTTLKEYIPNLSYFKEIAKQGFPAAFNLMTIAVGILIITYFISDFGQKAVAAYGVATRIEQLILLPTIGINVAVLTLVGQNYGAKLYNRVKEIYSTAVSYVVFMMTIGGAIIVFTTQYWIQLFTDDPQVIAIGSQYLFIDSFVFWGYVVIFISLSLLQGLKKPMLSAYVGIYRQIIGPLLLFLLVTKVFDFGLTGVWFAIFFLVWSSAVWVVLYTRHVLKKL